MPTYDYKCESCGRTFEFVQSMNDPRLETCIYEDCSGKVKRLLGTGAGIIFKGSGFYETDYRSESYKKGKDADKPAAASSDSGGDKKSAPKESGSSTTTPSAPAKTESKAAASTSS